MSDLSSETNIQSQKPKDDELEFTDLIDLQSLQRLQDSFANATHVASIITLPDGRPLTEPSNFTRLCQEVIRKTVRGLANCQRSDAVLGRPNPDGPIISPCLSCGLWDAGASIYAGDRHMANWLIGQVRNEALDEKRIYEYSTDIGADPEVFAAAFSEVPVMTTDQFRAVCDFLFLMANQLSATAYEKIIQHRQAQERERLERQLERGRKLESIGQLTGGVAHDFNNLLTAILGRVDLLYADAESGAVDARHLASELEEIQKAGSRAADLTRQLLAFSRQQISKPVNLDLNELLRRFEPILRSLIPESSRLQLALAPEALVIHVDPSQVEQIVLNFAVNARDAISQGGLISLETSRVFLDAQYVAQHPDAREGAHVRLTVADDGVGMTPEVITKIFEPFFTTKKRGHGTGMGLATTYGLVRQAGGHITVYSEPGKGSVFRVYIPEESSSPDALGEAAPTPDLCGTATVLVCEDSDDVRAVTVRFLSSAGYRPLPASGGAQALEILDATEPPPALLLTDVVMPDMHGKALAEAARERIRDLPVLFMSGYTANVIAHHGILDDGIHLVEKPFNRVELLTAVRKALSEA